MSPSLVLQILLVPSLALAVFNERHLLHRQDDCEGVSCGDFCLSFGNQCCDPATGTSCFVGSFCCNESPDGCCVIPEGPATTEITSDTATTDFTFSTEPTETTFDTTTTSDNTFDTVTTGSEPTSTSFTISSPAAIATMAQHAGGEAKDNNLGLQVFSFLFAAAGQLLQ